MSDVVRRPDLGKDPFASWSGRLPGKVVLRTFNVPVICRSCNKEVMIPARWVRYRNGKHNAEINGSATCPNCFCGGPYTEVKETMEVARSQHDPRWVPLGFPTQVGA